MLSLDNLRQLFTLHGELGYFDLFGTKKIPFMIIAPRGFGKSELFLKFIERFNMGYVKFTPVCADGIIFYQYSRNNVKFCSSSDSVAIRGRDGVNWNKKDPIRVKFDKNYFTSKDQLQQGILLVGVLGVKYQGKILNIIREKGHKIKISNEIELNSIEDPENYLFSLVKDLYFQPSKWLQLSLASDGPLASLEEEYQLISILSSFLPQRIIELTLPEEEDKWGQLNNVFSTLVEKIDELILNTVEEMLNSMLKAKMRYLYERSHFESLFPQNRQLANLTPLPTLFAMKAVLEERVAYAQRICLQCALPNTITNKLEEGLSSIKTIFIDQFDDELKRNQIMNVNKLANILEIHSLAINELIESVKKELVHADTIQRFNDTKEKLVSFTNTVKDLKGKEKLTEQDKEDFIISFEKFVYDLLK